MIQVTLHFETQDDLVAFFTRGATPVAAVAETAKVIEKAAKAPKTVTAKAVAVEKPAATPAASETATAAPQEAHAPAEPVPASPSDAPAYKIEDVRAALTALSQSGKQAQVKDLIASYNVAKLTDIKVSDYADLMAKAGQL